eukprot:9489046-Pyramimonas_sp.AAC.1
MLGRAPFRVPQHFDGYCIHPILYGNIVVGICHPSFHVPCKSMHSAPMSLSCRPPVHAPRVGRQHSPYCTH